MIMRWTARLIALFGLMSSCCGLSALLQHEFKLNNGLVILPSLFSVQEFKAAKHASQELSRKSLVKELNSLAEGDWRFHFIYLSLYLSVSIYLSPSLCLYLPLSVFSLIQTHTRTHTHTHVRMHTHSLSHTHTHITYTHAHHITHHTIIT